MMKNSNPYLILLLTVMCQIAFAQQKTKSEKDTTIPFELTGYNNLSVQAVLNQKDTVHLMFHTAASSMTVTAEAAQKLKSVHFDAVTDDIQSWGGQSNSSRLSKDNLVQIGNLNGRMFRFGKIRTPARIPMVNSVSTCLKIKS